jgi:ribosomal protein S18 acetylase RimI-like enzyme
MNARAGVAEAAHGALVPDRWLGERLNVAAFSLPADADPALLPGVRPAFLQTKVDISDAERLAALVRAGYALVETAVTLEMPIAKVREKGAGARFAAPADENAVRTIAAAAFTQSRFHTDPKIPKPVAARIKADWAGNFFSGTRGTHLVVADDGGVPAGFLLLIHRGEELVIDLVGVKPGAQSQGLGRAMLDFAAAQVEGPKRYVVGTQLHNTQSLAYYTGYGFRIVRAKHSLHRHLS